MSEDIHTTETESVAIEDRVWYKNVKTFGVVIRWVTIVALAAMSYYVYQRDVNAANIANLDAVTSRVSSIEKLMTEKGAVRDKQIDKLVTNDKFDERTNAINSRLDRIENVQQEILMRLPAR